MENDFDAATAVVQVGDRCRGGISAVLDAYGRMFPGIKRIDDYRGGGPVAKLTVMARACAVLALHLHRHPEVTAVHLHSASNGSFWRKAMLARIARLAGRKVVMHIHGGGFKEFYARHPRRVLGELRRADVVVALSRQWQEWFGSIGLPEVKVLRNPVATPSGHAVKPQHPAAICHWLFLGEISPQKGIFDLIEAIGSRAAALRGRFHLKAGGNKEWARLQARAEQLGIDDMVEYCGWVSGPLKEQLLGEADALALPSYAEGLPVAILEAMSHGCAILATPVGGIPEVVLPGTTGYLVQPGDIEGLGDALVAMSADTAATRAMGAEARKAAAPYLSDAVKASVLQIYRSLG